MSSILLLGGNGFLGSAVRSHFRFARQAVLASVRNPLAPDEFKMNLEESVGTPLHAAIEGKSFSAGIICAAFADVESCRKDPEYSQRVNVAAVKEILAIFSEQKIKPVFFSSDMVFDNTRNFYREDDPLTASTLYGQQKVAIEEYIQNNFSDYLIFRTSKLMSVRTHKKNILSHVIEPLRENRVVKAFSDQFITPVTVEDAASTTHASLAAGLSGIFHLASEEILSRLEIAQRICEKMGKPACLAQPISMREVSFSEPRGPNHILNSEKIRSALRMSFCSVDDAFEQMLRD